MGDTIKEYMKAGKKNILLIYVLFLLGIIVPFLAIIGGIFAYINKNTEDTIWRSHYIFAFRTFIFPFVIWVSITFLLLPILALIFTYLGNSGGLLVLMLGPFIIIMNIAMFIWLVVRSIIAIQLILADKPHPNPLTLGIK